MDYRNYFPGCMKKEDDALVSRLGELGLTLFMTGDDGGRVPIARLANPDEEVVSQLSVEQAREASTLLSRVRAGSDRQANIARKRLLGEEGEVRALRSKLDACNEQRNAALTISCGFRRIMELGLLTCLRLRKRKRDLIAGSVIESALLERELFNATQRFQHFLSQRSWLERNVENATGLIAILNEHVQARVQEVEDQEKENGSN